MASARTLCLPVLLAGAVVLAGCASPSSKPAAGTQKQTPSSKSKSRARAEPVSTVRIVSSVPVRRSGSWTGRYRGTNPSCTGSSRVCSPTTVVLTLRDSMTYTMERTSYKQGRPYTFSSQGRYRWDERTQTITLASKDANTRLYFSGQTLERTGSDTMSAADVVREPMVLRRF